jgi:ankyrin repeat protein
LAKTGTIQEFKDFVDSSDDIKNVVCSNTAKDFNENSLLANAYDAKNTDIVRYFLEELKFDGNVIVNGYFEDTSVSDTPISNDDTKIKRSILGDKYSLSLIEFAALRNDYEFIDFLLNFLPKTKNEVTGKSGVNDALNLSTMLGHELCIPSLLNHKDIDLSIDSDILFERAILNHANMEPVIRALLTSEIPKEKFITGKNLYLALTKMNGKPDIFEMLLSHSIDIRKPLVNGWNLLHIAAHEGFTETLRFLLSDKVGNSFLRSSKGFLSRRILVFGPP